MRLGGLLPIKPLTQDDRFNLSPILAPEPLQEGTIPTPFLLKDIARRAGYVVKVEKYSAATKTLYRYWYSQAFVEAFTRDPWSIFDLPDLHCEPGHCPLHQWPHYATLPAYSIAVGGYDYTHTTGILLSKLHRNFNVPVYKSWEPCSKDAQGRKLGGKRPMTYHKLILHLALGEFLIEKPELLHNLWSTTGTIEDIYAIARHFPNLLEAYYVPPIYHHDR